MVLESLFFALIGSEISRVVVHLDHQELGVKYDQSPAVPPSALQSSQILAGVAPLAYPFFPSLGFADLDFVDDGDTAMLMWTGTTGWALLSQITVAADIGLVDLAN